MHNFDSFSHFAPFDLFSVTLSLRQFHVFRACLWQFLWSENGVALARFLRERKVNASIIYITDYPGFALDSFSVSPLEYPLKPVDEWRLAAALDWDRQQKRPVLRVGGRAISSGRDHLSEYLGP